MERRGGKMVRMTPFKLARMKAGFTQEELAEKLGVSKASICQWENGRTRPSIKKLKPLSEILNISVEELLKKVG